LFFFFHLTKVRYNRDNSVGQILYESERMKKRENLKKGVVTLVLLTAIGLPLACTTNNSSTPTAPITGHTATPGGPTSTPTTTLVPGATPTFTATFIATPAYMGNLGTSSAPNGMYFTGTSLYVAENDGVLPMVEIFGVNGAAVSLNSATNFVVEQSATTVLLDGPQGFASTGGYFGILDVASSGAATLYAGPSSIPSAPLTQSSWGNQGLKFPKGFTGDSQGNFYVADTGNGYVDEYQAAGSPGSFPIHRWKGYSSSNTFVQPYSVACDSNNNVFVGDVESGSSQIEEYASGGTTILGTFRTVPGCIVHGLAVDSSDNIYVADAGNALIEEYTLSGLLLREWGLPHSNFEFLTFSPSCIILTGTNIIVGDYFNEEIDVFGP
jgi:hypothetical protein